MLIHWEAVKLFCKGIPTFEHPLGSVVNFGFGITDKRMEGKYCTDYMLHQYTLFIPQLTHPCYAPCHAIPYFTHIFTFDAVHHIAHHIPTTNEWE